MENNIEKIKKIFLLSIILLPIIQLFSFFFKGFSNHMVLITSIIWIFLSVPLYIMTEKKSSSYLLIIINFLNFSILLSFFYHRISVEMSDVFTNIIVTIILFAVNYLILKYSKYNAFISNLFILLSGIFIILGIAQMNNDIEIMGGLIIVTSLLSISINLIYTILIEHENKYELLDIVKLYSLMLFISLLLLVLEELSEDSFIDHLIIPMGSKRNKLPSR